MIPRRSPLGAHSCDFCKESHRNVPAIGSCSIDRRQAWLCPRHFVSAQACGFEPRLYDQAFHCRWRRMLTEKDVSLLIEHGGDCVRAGIPCERHKPKQRETPATTAGDMDDHRGELGATPEASNIGRIDNART